MSYKYFSHNSQTLSSAQAVIPLSNVEYSYGFGVYETIRASKGKVHFLDEHCQRLMESARLIGLEHNFSGEAIKQNIQELLQKNAAETCNIKILLIGGRTADAANLYILCLNPLFPDRQLYREGAHCITRQYERIYPHAKTLNMLSSYLAYRDAKQAGAYDALAIDRDHNIVEGARTNFFGMQGKTLISPPADKILLGVTRDKVLAVAQSHGFEIQEKDIRLDEITRMDGAFLTSTSSKIMPVKSIDDTMLDGIPQELRQLMDVFDEFLSSQS